MNKFRSNWGPLFLVEAYSSYESPRLLYTAWNLETALAQCQEHVSGPGMDCHDDTVRIRVIEPGPGPGITVARWLSEYPRDVNWPCDGEGPPDRCPDPTWERVL